MAPLLSLAQQQAIKTISPNWANYVKTTGGTTNYEQLALEVEESDLQKLLGAALLQDLQDNPTETNNAILLNGGTFEDCNGNTIKFKGLRYVLAYMNYSQQILESDVADTFTGFVKKNRNEADGLSFGEKKQLMINAREKAMAQWELAKQFLNDNTDLYELWYCGQSRKPYRPKLIGVRKTRKR